MSKEPSIDEALNVVRMTILFLFSLFVFKIAVGLFSGSIALIADAFGSLSDTIMIIVLYLALRMIRKKPDRVFGYGYYRVEDILSLLMSVMFFIVAGKIMYDGLLAIVEGYSGSQHYELAVLTEIVAGISLFYVSGKQYKAAKKANITSLALSARDMRIDTLAAMFVAVSIFTNKYSSIPIEGYAAIIIGVLIILNAYRGFKTAMLNLLDAWRSPEIIGKIKAIINKTGYLRAGEIRLRRAGPIILGEATVYAPEELRVEDVDELLEEVEKEIYKKIPDLKEMLWEVEPLPENTELCVVPIKKIDSREILAPIFESADEFVVYEIDYTNKKATRKYSIPNRFGGKGSKSVKIVSKFLERGIDLVLARNIDYVTFSLLNAYEIEVYRVDTENVDEAINQLIQKKLKPAEEESVEEAEDKKQQAEITRIIELPMETDKQLIISREFLENNKVSKYVYPMSKPDIASDFTLDQENTLSATFISDQDLEEDNE